MRYRTLRPSPARETSAGTYVEHLFQQVRPPIDEFEQTLINAFSPLKSLQAIWVREIKSITGPKTSERAVWLQLGRRSRGDERAIDALVQELRVRIIDAPFFASFHVIVDDLPPAAVAPSCIFRRGSGRV